MDAEDGIFNHVGIIFASYNRAANLQVEHCRENGDHTPLAQNAAEGWALVRALPPAG